MTADLTAKEVIELALVNSFFLSSRRRHTRWPRDWSSDVCSSDLMTAEWGAWLAELSLNDDVVAATVTVESYPTTGQDLIAAVKDSVSESTPEIARRIQRSEERRVVQGRSSSRSRPSII